MEGTGIFLIVLIVILLLLCFLKEQWSRRHFPPGPLTLPVIGGIWKFNFGIGYNVETPIKLAKQYGDIFLLWAGNIPFVVLSGFEAVKEGLIDHSEDFSERPQTPFISAFSRGKGQPFDPALPITNSISNVICAISFGYRFPLEDETFKKMIDAMAFTLKFGGSLFYALYVMFPWLMKHLPGPHKEALCATEMLLSLAKKEIQKHKEQMSFQEPRDFIDFYLLEIEKLWMIESMESEYVGMETWQRWLTAKSSFDKLLGKNSPPFVLRYLGLVVAFFQKKNDPTSTYDEENLAQVIHDLFVAGTETTATSLKWAILLLANHPDIQDKAYKEIEDVLCSSFFCYQDLRKLPYTNAVLHEIQRSKYPLLFGLPRQTSKDVKMRGFLIPKGAAIIPNMRSVLLDPKYWESPKEFDPKYFLDQDGHFVAKEQFLTFGAGARVCLGEQLARMEFFIFLVNLLRAFRFQLPPGVKELNEEPEAGLTTPPHPYKVCAVPRCSSS